MLKLPDQLAIGSIIKRSMPLLLKVSVLEERMCEGRLPAVLLELAEADALWDMLDILTCGEYLLTVMVGDWAFVCTVRILVVAGFVPL